MILMGKLTPSVTPPKGGVQPRRVHGAYESYASQTLGAGYRPSPV